LRVEVKDGKYYEEGKESIVSLLLCKNLSGKGMVAPQFNLIKFS